MAEGSYQVLARRHRPRTFREVRGQEHVVRTLRNALASGRLVHAYLFAGPRGVGKTTLARILAKAINCPRPVEGDPCGTCPTCEEIAEGRFLDVMEIDGASHRGIAEVRDLRERVRYTPARGQRKVYIIDEVHMLTVEAFNALLKTLEEPPPHVLFVFATTAPHKVPETILSRCQRFDFRRFRIEEIAQALQDLLKREKILAEEEALFAIARKAGGSLRDALTLLDQAASYGEGAIDAAAIRAILGLVGVDVFLRATDLVARREPAGLLALVRELVEEGHDLGEFLTGYLEHLRNLLLLRISRGADEMVDLPPALRESHRRVADLFTPAELLALFEAVDKAEQGMRGAGRPRLLVEALLLRLVLQRQPASEAAAAAAGENAGARAGGEPLRPGSVKEASQARPAEGAAEARGPERGPSPLSLEEVRGLWGQVVERVKGKKRSLGTVLEGSRPLRLESGRLMIEIPGGTGFHREQLGLPLHKQILAEVLREVGASPLAVEAVSTPGAAVPLDEGEGIRNLRDILDAEVVG